MNNIAGYLKRITWLWIKIGNYYILEIYRVILLTSRYYLQ